MIKYAKIINQETGLCEVGLGTNVEFYKSIGMVELDVEQSDVNNNWYLTEKCPHKSEEEKEQEKRQRKAKLHMTKRDFFLYVVQPFGITYNQLIQALQSNDTLLACYEGCNHIYRGDEMLVGNIKTMLETMTGQTIDEQVLNAQLDVIFEEHNATD